MMCETNWAEWFAAAGTIATVIVALYLANRNERREQNNNLLKKWNRIYHHLRDMSIHLEVVSNYDKMIESAEVRYSQLAHHMQFPSDYDQRQTQNWMQRSSESFKSALVAESNIIDELAGEKGISIVDKAKIIRAIDMRTAHQKKSAQLGEQSKVIAILNEELVLPNLDPEFKGILNREEGSERPSTRSPTGEIEH